MLQIQKKYIEYLEKVLLSLGELNFSQISTKELEELKANIQEQELIAPVIGAFSSGKSTFINSFLQSEILNVDVVPETALATELRYNESDYYEAVKKNGSVDRYEISQGEQLKQKAKDYVYLRLFLKNENLKKSEPLVLVDMPGFDAPIELHNQAILSYLDKGIYFITLTSVQDGTITKSMQREIANIIELGKGFSFCLSKTNLKPESEVSEIKEEIEEQLKDQFDFFNSIIPLTNKSGESLEKILREIDSEKLFESIFIEDLVIQYVKVENSVNTIIKTLESSKEETSKAISELEKSIEKIYSKKEEMIRDVQSQDSTQNINPILNAIGTEILNNQESLINLAMSNQESFSREINEITKNILMSEVPSRIEKMQKNAIEDFKINIAQISSDLNISQADSLFSNILDDSLNVTTKAMPNGFSKLFLSKESKFVFMRGLSLLINPILGILITFLPDIFSLFGKSAREEKQKNEIRQKLVNEIISSIKSQVRGTLTSILKEKEGQIIQEIGNTIEKELSEKKEQIEKTKLEQEKNLQNSRDEIEKLQNLKQNLKQLKETYLGEK